ncbi:dolichyl-phosphate-mannose--protein mannosyltransferase, partial [Halobacteriales archaeon SW_12_67_38]
MVTGVRELLGRAWRQFADDLDADPYLSYLLVLAAVLSGFWFWHRIPDFATRDEKSRLLDVMVAFGTFLGDPGIESLRDGVV